MAVLEFDKFTEAYIVCALWSSTGDDEEPLDNDYGMEDIAPDSLASMVEDCRDFQESNAADLEGLDTEQCGHDFWLTRNGHGAGFWDRGLGELGDKLSEAAKAYGSCDLIVGDDGLIHAV